MEGRSGAGGRGGKQGGAGKPVALVAEGLRNAALVAALSVHFTVRRVAKTSGSDVLLAGATSVAIMIVETKHLSSSGSGSANADRVHDVASRMKHTHTIVLQDDDGLSRRGVADEFLAFQSSLVGKALDNTKSAYILPQLLLACDERTAAAMMLQLRRTLTDSVVEKVHTHVEEATRVRDTDLYRLLRHVPGIDYHNRTSVYMAMDAFGSLQRLGTASAEEIYHRTPMNWDDAAALHTFFAKEQLLD